jgi:hypothetical protein
MPTCPESPPMTKGSYSMHTPPSSTADASTTNSSHVEMASAVDPASAHAGRVAKQQRRTDDRSGDVAEAAAERGVYGSACL